MEREKLISKIKTLAKEKGYLIMAHNYQIPEIQDLADITGDSLELAKKALKIEEEKILFLGVDFMAQTIKVLNPQKKILVAVKEATCPMANSLTPSTIMKFKEKYPNAPVVLYVNSTVEAKALADYTCTSANALEVVEKIDSPIVLFGPDKNLASYVAKETGKEVIPIPGESGYCYVHDNFTKEEVEKRKREYQEALLMVHPEASPVIRNLADYVGSTGQMAKYPATVSTKQFIVGTEIGMVHKLKTLFPEKEFIPLSEEGICHNMKKTNLDNVREALEKEDKEIIISSELMEKALKPIERMFSLTA